MSKSFPTDNDRNVLDYLNDQSDSLTVKEIHAGGGWAAMKDTQYSITKLTNAGYIETTGKRAQTNPDGTAKRGRPSRLIAITDAGRAFLAS